MPHPLTFHDKSFGLAKLRKTCQLFPETTEVVAWGRPTFRVGKMFAVYSGSAKTEQPKVHVQYPHSILVKVDASERQALEQDSRFFIPAYFGPFGWLGLNLDSAKPDWDEIYELLDTSYRAVAPKRLIAQLNAGENPISL
ncbi:MAG: MmcQ/YjbR family DNA-binding protein [Mycobacteriaceae bacterium]